MTDKRSLGHSVLNVVPAGSHKGKEEALAYKYAQATTTNSIFIGESR